jgi:hypothetical protein
VPGFYDVLLAHDKQILYRVGFSKQSKLILTRADARCKDAFLPEQPLIKQLLRGWMNWRLGVYAAVVFALISLLPQTNFLRLRGRNWHGAFFTYHPDEMPYAVYVNSLIEGRARRNDPYSGRIDGPDGYLAESLMSIHFVPAYSLALPARWLGLSAMTMFILLTPLVAFASVMAIFWLISSLTKDSRVAAAGALFVVSMGGLARGQFFVRNLGGIATPYISMPLLRRYEPAFAFALFFIFCGLVWWMLRAKDRRSVLATLIAAALVFSALVFSYYFLWTAAAAWMLSLIIVSAITRPAPGSISRLALCALLMILPLIPYGYLLSRRAASMDAEQALTFTHTPDLLRPPAVLCVLLLLMLFSAVWRRRCERTDPIWKSAATFAMAPLIMFNQQVVTGRSLQPIHYEQFVANYVSLVALVLTAVVLWTAFKPARKIPALLLIVVSVISMARASQEVWLAARGRVTLSTIVDEGQGAALRLAELGQNPLGSAHARSDCVLVISPVAFMVSDSLPITAPQSVLWAPHMFSFAGLAPRENRERLYQQLYYLGVDQQTLRADTLAHIYFRLANFGWERVIQGLSANWQPITGAEEQVALSEYQSYVDTFDAKRAASSQLAYVIAPVDVTTDFARVDRWYERDLGERAGAYMIYRVKLRP